MRFRKLKLPPTRTHTQLAKFINSHKLYDTKGREVCAHIQSWTENTDRKIGRLRWPGNGRKGIKLVIWPVGVPPWPSNALYEHTSSETYRRHSEAREWVETNLRLKG